MRRSSAWLGYALCLLCASLAARAREQQQPEDDEMIPGLIREDEPVPGTGAEPAAEFLRCNKAAWRVPGQYLVILREEAHESQLQRTVRRLKAKVTRRGHDLEVLQTFSGPPRGFVVKMSGDVIQLAVTLPHVHYVEEDSSIFAQSAPWNLQRLLQPRGVLSENATYRPANDGGKAEVYLMDGSVQRAHREIEGRVLITDFTSVPEEDGVRAHRQASQCQGHGTHIAGVLSGADSGVARGVGINLVRVLNCQGRGTLSGALAGVAYIQSTLAARPADAAVILMPFVGGFSRSLNAACRGLVAGGAVVVAAAGNYRDDSCLYSPASEPEVITVGAVNAADQLMSQGAGGSNFGRCVDLFAPGDDIVSASSDCSTCFTSRSGTSQAAAHVAGIAAVTLSSNRAAAPAQLLQMLLRSSVSSTIDLLSLSETHQLTTPNLVAAMPPADNAATNEELLCRSVWSEKSQAVGGDGVVSRCRRGEEMMGCSSYAPHGARVGETITVTNGRMECVAHDGPGGGGVYAVARCCVISGLQCRAHAGPGPGRDAHCLEPQQRLTGCTSWSPSEVRAASRPHHGPGSRCGGEHGVTSHAVCCHAPSLECRIVEHVSADRRQVEVSCPSGWTLTDCRAVAHDSAVLGPVAKGNGCRVRGATAAAGGIAVCCRVGPQPSADAAAQHLAVP